MRGVAVPALFLALSAGIPAAAQTRRTLTVDELFTLVESGSNTLRSQKAGVDVAGHAVAEAKSRRLPDVYAELSASYNGNVVMADRDFGHARGLRQPHFGNSLAIVAEQTVYAGGAVDAGVRLAETQKRQAENAVAQGRARQRMAALDMYLGLYKADNRIKVYEQNIALTVRLIADIRAMQDEGMALKNDVTRYELQMETLRLALRQTRDRRDVLNHRLCNATGLAPFNRNRTRLGPSPPWLLTMPRPTSGQARAAAQSPLLRAKTLGVEQAEQQLRIAKSDLLPKVAVFATDNFSGPFVYDLPPVNKNFNIWAVGIGVRYSLSSLFKGNKAVRRAKAAVIMSRDEHAVAAETVDNEMQEAYTLYRQSFVELRTRIKSVELAAQNYGVVSSRYKAQMALVTDMIDASNVKLDAELSAVDARIDIVYAYYMMKYVAGDI